LTPDPAPRDRLFNLFHQLVESSLGLMCVHDLDGNLLFVNAAAANALGFRPEDGIGWNLRRYLAPAVQTEFDVYLERIRSTGVDSGLMRLVGKDGTEQVWLYRNTRYEEPGHPPVVLGQAQDVTDLIRTQRRLRESDRRFRILADAAPVMIWMSDSSGRCVFFNDAWLRFRGRTVEQEQDDRWLEGVHPDDRARCVEARRAAASTHQPFRLEYRLQRANGEYRWVLDHGVPRAEAEGELGELIGSCVDITELRQAREILEQAHDELAQLVAARTTELVRANEELQIQIARRDELQEELARARRFESLGLLASGVAHEFNNLLTVVYGRSQLLQNRVGSDPRLHRDLEDIERAAQRAAALTGQLLAFGKRQLLYPRRLDLNRLLLDMCPRLQELLGSRVDLEPVLDPTVSHIQADARQIEQLIFDLVRHAREAMPEGGRLLLDTTNVEVDAAFLETHPGSRPGRYVRLGIRDSGMGMDATTRVRVFEPFFTTHVRRGSGGIGLAAAYGIVKQHGGYISVESPPDGGTMFRVYFPIPESAEEPPAPSTSRRVRSALAKATVLLVEDEPALRRLAREILEHEGYSIIEANDGSQALALSERHAGPIHVLLTDVLMPHMSGPELADILARTHSGLRVVYMSGFAGDVIDRHRASWTGTRFLPKPFTAETLLGEVRAALTD
jgi:PAS domain S-box-containing protein